MELPASKAALMLLLAAALFPAQSLAAFGRGNSNSNSGKPRDAILLSQVETLTLRGHGAKTKHRRVSAVPQLKCVSHPSLCRLAEASLDVMRCTNQGASYGDEDVEWSCTAQLPEELKLGSTDVVCEGYAGPDDPYVLKGSCAVEYHVALTSRGERRYPDLASASDADSAWRPLLFIGCVIVLIIGLAMYCSPAENGSNALNRRGRRPGGGGGGGGGRPGGGGGGGGGWGGWNPGFGGGANDPPPPYPGTKPSSAQQSWRPGFWSGLAAGAAGAYAAGSARNRNQDRDPYYANYPRYGGESSSSRWGGGGGSSPGQSSSGPSHESTGFGSTRRR